MTEETSCATHNAPTEAADDHALKQEPSESVTKIVAYENIAA